MYVFKVYNMIDIQIYSEMIVIKPINFAASHIITIFEFFKGEHPEATLSAFLVFNSELLTAIKCYIVLHL